MGPPLNSKGEDVAQVYPVAQVFPIAQVTDITQEWLVRRIWYVLSARSSVAVVSSPWHTRCKKALGRKDIQVMGLYLNERLTVYTKKIRPICMGM